MEKTTKKQKLSSGTVLLIGIVCGVIVCAAMFVILGVYMSFSSTKTINQAGELFMTGIGRQAVLRYNAVIDQRITMVKGLDQTYASDAENVNESLESAAEARLFNYLAFMDEDGNIEMVFDNQVILDDPEPFIASMRAHESKAAVATSVNADGNTAERRVVLIGCYTEDGYFMKNGKRSIALIGGLENSVITDMLSQNNSNGDNEQRYETHIIRKNGTFVIRGDENNSNGDEYNNYFLQIMHEFDMSEDETKNLVNSMTESMDEGKIFSQVLTLKSSRKHMYIEQLSHSEWQLVMIMEYKALDGIVGRLSTEWTAFTIGSAAVVITVMIIIFSIYFFMNRQTMKQLEEARSSAVQATKAKSEFLSNMSHDIRTPMNAIVGMTAIATANIDNKQQVSECLKKISLSSRHLLGLINDVLDMSKIESGKMTLNMEKISLNEVTEGIATIIQPQIKIKKQNFSIHVHEIISEDVYCDSVRLNQVLLNLLSNAYKFTPEGGTIELALHQEPSPIGDHYVRTFINVRDNGIGMSPEFQKKIFDSFTREDSARVHKTEGTGLGMSITKYIIDAMHGTISVESAQGAGTVFHIIIDLEKAETEESEMLLPNWKMLVVDDDATLCETAVASLKSIGIDAVSTLNGESAITMAEEAHGNGKDFDIILLDWKLSEIDGIETARRLRASLGDIPIILISAYDWSEIENEAREAGITGFISKPLFKSTLFYGLKQYISGADSADDNTSSKKQVNLEGKKLLVAEDNDLNWEIAELLLEDAGLEVERAENGEICIDMLRKAKPGTYDAILMDLRMPVMGGIEATTAIRNSDIPDKDLPIIAMTADAFSDDIKKCLDCGMNAHIAKPIDIDTVKSTLLKFLVDKD